MKVGCGEAKKRAIPKLPEIWKNDKQLVELEETKFCSLKAKGKGNYRTTEIYKDYIYTTYAKKNNTFITTNLK